MPLILHVLISLSELFATEHAHVRMLSVLQWVFAKQMEREQLLTAVEIEAIFPNLEEIIEMHCECCSYHTALKYFASRTFSNGNRITKPLYIWLLMFLFVKWSFYFNINHRYQVKVVNQTKRKDVYVVYFSGQKDWIEEKRSCSLDWESMLSFVCLWILDNFYENLKKLRVNENYIVKKISTTLRNRVSSLSFFVGHAYSISMFILFCFPPASHSVNLCVLVWWPRGRMVSETDFQVLQSPDLGPWPDQAKTEERAPL